MPTATAITQIGGYISLVKLISLIVLFIAWIPLIYWVVADAKKVHATVANWTTVMFLAGAVGFFVWLLIPLFIIGLCMYLLAVGSTALLYVVHRNSLVDTYEKILTAEHIKSLLVNEEKQAQKITKGLEFITANKNKAPIPQMKTPEFFGFKIAQEVFDDAIWKRADSIILRPAAQQYDVIFVIDGVAEKQEPQEKEDIEYFIYYLKNLGDLDTKERRKPQKGKFRVNKDGQPFDWEVTTAGTTAGEQAQIKHFAEYNVMKIDEIGLLPDQIESINKLKENDNGVFIISGPKKNGVTSTFYAMIKNHDPFLNNINTLEKQPAGELPNVTQNVYSMSDTGTTTYARRFQTMLRTGPDIVGAEHCQEKELAKLASSAAKEKILYITMETKSVIEAVTAWIQLVGDKNNAIKNLAGISNQRIIRKLCDQCREAYEPNKDMLRKFNIPADKVKLFYRPGQVQYDKHGKPIICQHCQGTGFYGRTAIFEIIILNDEIRQALQAAQKTTDIVNIFRRAKMLYLQEQAIRKVATGVISINEVIRALSGPQSDSRKKTQQKK